MRNIAKVWLFSFIISVCINANANHHQLPVIEGNTTVAPVTLSDDNLLIVDISIKNIKTDHIIELYQYDGGYMLPLSQITQALEFPIKVNVSQGYAEGWFVDENRNFVLDIPGNSITIQGHKKTLGTRQISKNLYDLYIDASLLAEWLKFDYSLNYTDLNLKILPKENIPLLKRIERQKRRNSIRNYNIGKPNYELITTGYKAISQPFFDIDLGYNYANNLSEKHRITYSTLSHNDIAFINTRFFASGETNNQLNSIRLRGERKNHNADMLGPLEATELMFGDINNYSSPLVTNTSLGRGIAISNYALERPDKFDTINIIDEALPGWEAELYRNNILLDFQTISDNGRYEFKDIPLFYGNNTFRIVLYGPQGEIREYTKNYMINDSILQKGTLNYRLSIDDKSQSIFGVDEKNRNINHRKGIRIVSNADYGITDRMTGSLGIVRTPLEDQEFHHYQTIALRNSFSYMSTDTSLAFDHENDSWASQISASTRIKNLSIRAKHSHFDNFSSEIQNPNSIKKENISSIDASGNIPKILPQGLSFTLGSDYTTYENNSNTTTIRNKLSTSVKGITLNHAIQSRIINNNDTGNTTNTNASASVRTRVKKFALRLTNNYELDPQARMESVNFAINRKLDNHLNMGLDIEKNLTDQRTTTGRLSVNKQFEHFRISNFFSTNSEEDITLGTKLSLSFGHEPIEKRWVVKGKNFAGTGIVSATAFYDKNYNNKKDDNEKIINSIAFKARGTTYYTENNKPALISNLRPYVPTDILINIETLEDPLLHPIKPAYSVVTRPGIVTHISFPVIATSEMEGTIYIKKHGKKLPVSAVTVQLVNKNGQVAFSTKSEFDGFYVIEKITPGDYSLKIAEKDLKTLEIKNATIRNVTITKESNILTKDLILAP